MSDPDDAVDAELSDLRVFVQIVAAGTLSEAARRLGMSLTFISRRLSRLEDKVRARLIDRGPHKFMLTDEGFLFYERVIVVLEAADSAVTEVRALRGRIEGSLRISAPAEIGRRQIARLCSQFSATHPELKIELTLTDVRPDILRDELDIAIVTKRPVDGDVIQRKIFQSRRIICAAPAYISQFGSPKTPEDLRHHRCILLRRGAQLYDRWTIKTKEEVSKVQVPHTLVASSTDVVHAWALDGLGIAVKALWDVEEDVKEGRLLHLLADYGIDNIYLYATYSSRRHLPLRVRKFIDFLIKELPVGSITL